MAKKKKAQEKKEAEDTKRSTKENKGPKSYKGTSEKKGNANDEFQKIQLPQDKESIILDLILSYKSRQKVTGSISQRLTIKKLTDLYNALNEAGFKQSHIEQAMSSVVQYGGDLVDALDWLCLNLPNDQLPSGFSLTLTQEENKRRPKFSQTHKAKDRDVNVTMQAAPDEDVCDTSHSTPDPSESSQGAEGGNVKDWILRYADQSSEDSDEDGVEMQEADPNSTYLVLTAKLLDAKELAAQAKEQGDKAKHKQLSANIRTYIQEMDHIESLPIFNPQLKLQEDKVAKPRDVPVAKIINKAEEKKPEEEGGELGFSMFEEQAAAEKPAPTQKDKATKFEKREFSYTRQQWTGKSPKQFLIDWVRKHLPKSPPPSYEKVKSGGHLWRTKCRVRRKEGDLVVCPDRIVCENVKDAEHLSSTLALYHLCKGQRVYTLLPPPFRDCWLEWQDADGALLAANKTEENKPRDTYIAKLMKKLKVDEQGGEDAGNGQDGETAAVDKRGVEEEEDDDDIGETWEDLASDEESDVVSSPTKKAGVSLAHLKSLLERKQQSKTYAKLLETRIQLPVYSFKDAIVNAVRQNSVLVIAGDTGSGKSTQIPHFVLEDLLQSLRCGNVVCTEPRRISAISLAQRVCEELGDGKPGNPNTLCGYQIRFESKKCDSTRLLYCTTGVLLRKLQLDPLLSDISHVIVDEVHERSVQSDFLLIILRKILESRKDFKVILMSATADSAKFSSYFKHCPVFSIPGRMFPVQVSYIEDVIETTKYHLEEESPYSVRYDSLIEEEKSQVQITGKGGQAHSMEATWTKDNINTIDKSGLDSSSYTLRTRNIVTRLDPERINMELLLELLACLGTAPEYRAITGAVLVFMPGLAHIQELHDLLQSDPRFMDASKYELIALHSVLSSADQSKAFSVPPSGVRKIVIATNIAETGITIPDVVFVVDTGKVKETKYMETSQLSSLQEVFISKASGKQRAGRAGRVQDGYCFRLYTKHKWDSLRDYTVPEILRVPLEELCLHIMKSDLGHPVKFLSEALDPPNVASIERAMNILREVGACDYRSPPSLTPLGQHLAALPVSVRIGKMLVYAAILGCLEPMSVVAAAMTEKSPFAVPMGKRSEADAARASMAIANSDHITLYKAYVGWKDAQTRGYASEMQYCNKNFLKRMGLLDIENVATDLRNLVCSIGFQSYSADQLLKLVKRSKCVIKDGVLNISEWGGGLSLAVLSPQLISVMKCILAAGLYPNVGRVSYTAAVDSVANPTKQVCMAVTPQGPAAAHPASVNRFLAANGFLVYHEKVRLSRVYLRDSTLVGGLPLLLFGGAIDVQHSQQLITVEDWINFKAPARTGVMFKELRVLLEDLLARKLTVPQLNVAGEPLVQLLLELIVADRGR